jgi:hypothetical protein
MSSACLALFAQPVQARTNDQTWQVDKLFATYSKPVYGELLFRQATWHATHCYIPFLCVIDFTSAFNCGEAHALI